MTADQRFYIILTALGMLGALLVFMARLLWSLASTLTADRMATKENTKAIEKLTKATEDNTREINQLKLEMAKRAPPVRRA